MTKSQATVPVRGAIEGFYGPPFSHEQRLSLLRFLGEQHYNCYVYAPKNDPLHRERWREPYTREELARFRALATFAASQGVDFLYAIAPGLTYDAGDARDFALLAAKIEALVDTGVRGIALLFDDLGADSTMLDPVQQAELVARLAAHVACLDPSLAFWFIGNFYCGDATELCAGGGFWGALYGRKATDYFAAYAEHVPANVPILWTGPAVFSARISARDVAAFRSLVGRPVILWDNFPVNDTLPGQLFLGPYLGREPAALAELHGVVLNLMSQAAANWLPLAAAAPFFLQPEAYDPDDAMERAIAAVAPDDEARAALALFVEQHRGHPVLAADQTARALAARVAEAFADDARDEASLEDLRRYLESLAENEAVLRRALRGREILPAIAPWSEQLTRLARAALRGLDALDGVGSVASYEDARCAAQAGTCVVAATVLPSALLPFVAGQGEVVDRFAALFAGIDRRLAARRGGSP